MKRDLEKMIRQMNLQAPGADLDEKVQRALRGEAAAEVRAGSIWVGWAGRAAAFAAACVAGLGLWLWMHSGDGGEMSGTNPAAMSAGVDSPGDLREASFNPVRIAEVYSDVTPEGQVRVGQHAPIRRFRYQQLEHIRYIDAERNIEIEMMIPHEEILYVPLQEQ